MSGLDLVSAGDWRTLECWRTAWGAQDVLEQARVFEDLRGALAETTLAVAFTGKRDRNAPADDVREAAAEVARLGTDDAAALVFGPETSGLTREELALCGRRASIPADPEQPSLNLSHAVMVAAYEVFRARTPMRAAPRRATHEEKQAMLELLREGLLAIRALSTENDGGYFLEWRNLFQRAELTPGEVRMLEHMARKMKGAVRA
jgi:tRNA/rRNA methyltransferase